MYRTKKRACTHDFSNIAKIWHESRAETKRYCFSCYCKVNKAVQPFVPEQ